MIETTCQDVLIPCRKAGDPGAVAGEIGLLLRAEEIDTVGKSIAFLVQEILLNGFDGINHADLAARIELILKAMPSAQPIILGMQFALFDGDYALALDHARLLVERETTLMATARARLDSVIAQA